MFCNIFVFSSIIFTYTKLSSFYFCISRFNFKKVDAFPYCIMWRYLNDLLKRSITLLVILNRIIIIVSCLQKETTKYFLLQQTVRPIKVFSKCSVIDRKSSSVLIKYWDFKSLSKTFITYRTCIKAKAHKCFTWRRKSRIFSIFFLCFHFYSLYFFPPNALNNKIYKVVLFILTGWVVPRWNVTDLIYRWIATNGPLLWRHILWG